MTGEITLKMAAALLLKEGKLTLSEIEALPFVDSEKLAQAIALSLYNRFDVEWEEDTIRLIKPGLESREAEKSGDDLTREEFEKILERVISPVES